MYHCIARSYAPCVECRAGMGALKVVEQPVLSRLGLNRLWFVVAMGA